MKFVSSHALGNQPVKEAEQDLGSKIRGVRVLAQSLRAQPPRQAVEWHHSLSLSEARSVEADYPPVL